MGKLYSALTYIYQAAVILERATTQSEIELQKADKVMANYSEQKKLMLQLTEKLEASDKKALLLEKACRALMAQTEQVEEILRKAANEL